MTAGVLVTCVVMEVFLLVLIDITQVRINPLINTGKLFYVFYLFVLTCAGNNQLFCTFLDFSTQAFIISNFYCLLWALFSSIHMDLWEWLFLELACDLLNLINNSVVFFLLNLTDANIM